MSEEYVDLLGLQQQLREGLEDLFPAKLWVIAEISSISVKANGHCYLDLVQAGDNGVVLAKARAVIWKFRYVPLSQYFTSVTGNRLSAGMTVLFRVQVNYSELYGLSLVVDELEPQFTLGRQELERRRTIEKLTADGLMDAQQALELAPLPYSLAVVSAEGAAGLGDFLRHLHENEYGFVFATELFEATMQGADAPASICDALDRIQTCGRRFDAVLLMRGGGSNQDLACFDDYALCFAIANCSIPVFSAIGHDRDRHVVDMVSYASVKTPTALADLFISCYEAEDERLSSFVSRLRMAFVSKISIMESRLDVLMSRISAADPRGIIARGYVLALDGSGKVLKRAESLSVGEDVSLMLSDGTVSCRVNDIKMK